MVGILSYDTFIKFDFMFRFPTSEVDQSEIEWVKLSVFFTYPMHSGGLHSGRLFSLMLAGWRWFKLRFQTSLSVALKREMIG